jgi:TRAP-type C4-dicarboxylate transport system permease small subunit
VGTKEKPFDIKRFFIDIDQYIGAIIFIVIMLLLTVQVVSRYAFSFSLTWTEELSVLLFVFMTYFGISSAVTYRKHLRIDALLDAVPFRVKRVLLIVSDLVFIGFNTYIIFPFVNIIEGLGNSKSSILGIPKAISYVLIPAMMTISSLKILYDIYRLCHEKEKNLGASKPSIDFAAIEREREGIS